MFVSPHLFWNIRPIFYPYKCLKLSFFGVENSLVLLKILNITLTRRGNILFLNL
jgi:hypothetical protein